MAEEVEETFTSDEVVEQLRQICKNLDIQKPCEETLRSIHKLIESEGDKKITMT